MQQAAVALVLTPAPDLPSLRAKIAVVRAHQLDEPDAMPRRPLDVLDGDLWRIQRAREKDFCCSRERAPTAP